MIIFLFFPKNRIWNFMQIVSLGDNLHECHILFSGKNKKNISKCCLLKVLPRVLSVIWINQVSVFIWKNCFPTWLYFGRSLIVHSLARWVNFSKDDIFRIFFIFFPENRFWRQWAWNVISYFLQKKKKIVNLSSAEKNQKSKAKLVKHGH